MAIVSLNKAVENLNDSASFDLHSGMHPRTRGLARHCFEAFQNNMIRTILWIRSSDSKDVMETIFTQGHFSGPTAQYLSSEGYSCDVSGSTIMAMPPGRVDLDIRLGNALSVIVPAAPARHSAFLLNGEKRNLATTVQGGAVFLGGGSDMVIQCDNLDWELMLDLGPESVQRVAAEQAEHVDLARIDMTGGTDQTAALLSRLAIEHLRQSVVDRLYLDGLSTAITARVLAFAMPDRAAPSTKGTDRRIDRTIDYIHARLVSHMSIADLAAVACMSPSWFSRAFRAQTGMTVHAYVQEKRLEQAYTAIVTSNEKIASIAWAYGFADHAHLSRLFKRRYGTTPSAARN